MSGIEVASHHKGEIQVKENDNEKKINNDKNNENDNELEILKRR